MAQLYALPVEERIVGDEAITDRTELLVQNKARFLAFLERRLRSLVDAEDLLQTAYLKALAEGQTVRDEEKIVPWFYQLLRNLLVDHYRRRGATARLEEHLTHETETTAVIDDEELFREVCRCVKDVSEALKDEYREILLRVELGDEPLPEVASDLGITPNNASVRLHRARRALRTGLQETCGVCTEHGCLDCTCRKSAHGPSHPH
jgi:RNA polymerase sigma factor (sigma-70 family)